MEFPELYKKDENENIRVWWMEVEEDRYRAHSGVLGGKIVTSKWKTAIPKNEGKTNSTTGAEQALSEIEAKYTFQKFQGKYFETVEEAQKTKAQYFNPMLAKKYEDVNFTFPIFAQPKLDGVRCIATKEGLFSRNGKRLVATPHISEALEEFFDNNPEAVLDGELYNHELKHDFERIISLARKTKPTDLDLEESEMIQYHIYDIVSDKTFNDRFYTAKDDIEAILTSAYDFGCIKIVDTFLVDSQEMLDMYYGKFLEDGYEGQMLRDTSTGYEQKRSKSLLKRKEFEDAEFEIVSIEEGIGNWAGYAKVCVIRLEDGTTQKASLRGNFKDNKKLLDEREEYAGGEATVRYQNRTSDGKLRFGVVTAFYKNKRDL
jgi:ATP-dependent DNA ligase